MFAAMLVGFKFDDMEERSRIFYKVEVSFREQLVIEL
jgi:hypothetical protein